MFTPNIKPKPFSDFDITIERDNVKIYVSNINSELIFFSLSINGTYSHRLTQYFSLNASKVFNMSLN